MQPRTLSGTGLTVSPLCLGGTSYGTTIPEPDTFALFDRYVALGGNFFDTARIYSDWVPGEKHRSERILGDWLQARGNRSRLVIATKGAHPFIESLHTSRTSAAEIRDDLEGSLRTLRTDVIDLYWLHRDEATRPVEHFVDLLNGFLREGKIRAFGGSNWSAARLHAANAYAQRSGQQGFAASQPLWCLGSAQARPPADQGLVRFDRASYDFHRATGLAVVPYTSQAKGFYTKLTLPPEMRPADLAQNEYHTPPNLAAAAVAGRIARHRGVNVSAIVLAYLWSRPFPVVPIVGCRTPAQLEDCLAALPVRLTAPELAELEAAAQSGLPAGP
jgi:aryl-alcohol dehydrogenase-like predicted oxidoreductase